MRRLEQQLACRSLRWSHLIAYTEAQGNTGAVDLPALPPYIIAFAMNPNGRRRLWQGLAGLLGAAGVALAAASAHLAASAQAPNLQLASGFLVFHALALLGVAALSHAGVRWLAVAGALFAFGSAPDSSTLAPENCRK